eukprot:1804242-Alexandrium_andersonii.AAC.1
MQRRSCRLPGSGDRAPGRGLGRIAVAGRSGLPLGPDGARPAPPRGVRVRRRPHLRAPSREDRGDRGR